MVLYPVSNFLGFTIVLWKDVLPPKEAPWLALRVGRPRARSTQIGVGRVL